VADAQFEVNAGASQDSASRSAWTGVSGSWVVMNGGVFAANRVSDAFAIVDVDDQARVPVYFENQLVGRTNRRGRLLIPWVTAYYPASYRISPLSLDPDVVITATEQRVAVRQNTGAVVPFPVRQVRAATLSLVRPDGGFVPAGSHAAQINGQPVVVGWDGFLYLENAQSGPVTVTMPSGDRCEARLDVTAGSTGINRLGKVVCR
jgi:outer membrane usher protein